MLGRRIHDFRQDVAGAVFVQVALVFMALSGIAGLAIDVGFWYTAQQGMQAAGDAAATAGAYEALWGADADAVEAAAKADAARNGFDPATVTVNYPPSSGTEITSAAAVEVIMRQGVPGMFSALVMNRGALDIATRSVAGRVDGTPICVLALEPGSMGIHLSSGSVLTATDCMVQANSSDSNAIDIGGGSSLTAAAIGVVGGVGSSAGLSPAPETGIGAVADPLAHLSPPDLANGGCDNPSRRVVGGGTVSLVAGVYCGGIEIYGGADVTFGPGIYVVRDGSLQTHGTSSIRGTGVVFYLSGTGALVDINGSGEVDFSAPVDGELPGLIFYQGPDAPAGATSKISGSNLRLEGALYFPDQRLDITGGSTNLSVPPFTTIIANSLHLHDSSVLTVDSNYAVSGVPASLALGQYSIAILE
jgi:Flp pilus assembly protein TadG